VQAGHEPREMCSLDEGRIALLVLGKSYCAVLAPLCSLGVMPTEIALQTESVPMSPAVPAGEMCCGSVLVDAYSRRSRTTDGAKEVRQSELGSKSLQGMIPPLAVVRLRKKDASLIHLRCVGSIVHVFLAESRATLFEAKGIKLRQGASGLTQAKGDTEAYGSGSGLGSGSSSGAGAVPMKSDGSSDDESACILAWSLVDLSSEFNGDTPALARLLPW